MSMRHLAQTLVGLVLAATPLALWIAWSPALFVGTLVVVVLGAGLLVLLTEAQPEHGAGEGVRLSDEFLQEVQRLHPMIYHHSGRRSSRFQRTMRRLSQMIRENERGASPR